MCNLSQFGAMNRLALSPVRWIALFGILWTLVGMGLVGKGIKILLPVDSAILWIALSMTVGIAKGCFVLANAVERVSQRLLSLAPLVPFQQAISLPYLALILGMVGLGIVLKHFPIPPALHGSIDLAVGTALFVGGYLYILIARIIRRKAATTDQT